ncbi:PulJ/GspJ family protein [Aureliella helgolandensis]|uniref:Prepilin-type N-terminal cleavage/methylation domain-containing protein n=1 Tax=Aureliella helgolandensis TaxID=2527968 RepID=A0A518FZE9_9BACT|nr:hypothetical protein [Aureliella helgolandensis]QDV21738.1 hypothetical protein Q31a_00170 [Aureliella helgolandensis]
MVGVRRSCGLQTRQRRGMQLLEVVVSLASAAILMAGISSSIVLANRSMEIATTRTQLVSRNQTALDRLRNDLAESVAVTGRSSDAVTFQVRDRDGDALPETISYAWAGAGEPLAMSTNAGPWLEASEDLDAFEFDWHAAPSVASATPIEFDPPGQFVLQSQVSSFTALSGSLSISLPPTYRAGDLLVAALAVSGDPGATSSTTLSGGWNFAGYINRSSTSLGTIYSTAPVGNSLVIDWPSIRNATVLVAHFSSPTGTASLDSYTQATGNSPNATAPEGTAYQNDSLVIRAIARDYTSQSRDNATNLPGHVCVGTKLQLFLPGVSMACRNANTGVVPGDTLRLTGNVNYGCATLVFSP